ncbi:type I glyceraldehyde-3-phosphate dehydrogenase [Candidatus Endobugula sertula]|uniref:Glyceraldehyde-3-phosphate dehydrogenase n=1 Tax=Candidatus Endobugula sertula TaxID=62101 RepID=A0A1D2QTA0_9GAMM|nr:type I glyceraldehyde-3-phosphate dehydrogenase [Candidatus Endobugula sertula]
MSLNIAINGYGRIGRCVLRAFYESSLCDDDISIVAINELADSKTIAYLTKYDSTHGKFAGEVSLDGGVLTVNNDVIRIFHEKRIEQLFWGPLGVDVVLECTGSFTDRKTAEKHLVGGAKKVLFSQPAESDVDVTIVYGINDSLLLPEHKIISNASCTTNCIVPVIDALDKAFGVESGVITTIHSAMNDQPVIDAYHHTDLRKTRSVMQSIIPVDTGLAKGIDRVLPALAGRFQAQAMRVPTINVSAMDLSITTQQCVTTAEVNATLKAASEKIPHILGYTEEPLASCDFNHDTRSSIVDASQTRVAGTQLVKVLTWFDNEWGFANRMLDVVRQLKSITKGPG